MDDMLLFYLSTYSKVLEGFVIADPQRGECQVKCELGVSHCGP